MNIDFVVSNINILLSFIYFVRNQVYVNINDILHYNRYKIINFKLTLIMKYVSRETLAKSSIYIK